MILSTKFCEEIWLVQIKGLMFIPGSLSYAAGGEVDLSVIWDTIDILAHLASLCQVLC